MSTIDMLPDSRDVAAEIAKHIAEARRLRALYRTLRRIEQDTNERGNSRLKGECHDPK